MVSKHFQKRGKTNRKTMNANSIALCSQHINSVRTYTHEYVKEKRSYPGKKLCPAWMLMTVNMHPKLAKALCAVCFSQFHCSEFQFAKCPSRPHI